MKFIEPYFFRPARKIAQIPFLSNSEIMAYIRGPINKLTSRYHRSRIQEFNLFEDTQAQFFSSILGIDPIDIKEYESEFLQLMPQVESFLNMASTSDIQLVRLYFYLIRHLKPVKIIETGVWHGVSTFFILSAIELNQKGNLASIDLPPMDPKTRVEVGGAVPSGLKDSWNLLKGPSYSELPKALSLLGSCDLFIHDGEHTYPNMMFEFRSVWDHLPPESFIIIDDAHWNDSVLDFRDEKNCKLWTFPRDKGGYVAILSKRDA